MIVSMASHYDDTATAASPHRWEEAGEAWGSRAVDWSCLYEHYSLDILVALLPRLGVGPGTSLLDVACGSGLAVRVADGMGADVAGIDAAAELVAVACDRTPTADLRVGSMFELPWTDERFDAAVSVNGIWGGCGAALDESLPGAATRWSGGHQFLGAGPTPRHPRGVQGLRGLTHRNSTGARCDASTTSPRPASPRRCWRASGFSVLERGGRVSTMEWPDADIAWRAVSSVGPAVPALRSNDPAVLRDAVLAALEPCRDQRGVYRTRSDHQFVVARKP